MNEEISQLNKNYYYIDNDIDYQNYPFTIITGGRNIGKTFSAKKYLFDRAVNQRKPFICLVREVGEIDEVSNTFFDNLQGKGVLDNYEFYTYCLGKFGKIIATEINGEEYKISIVLPLKKSDTIKRLSLENTCGLFFDELIPESGCYLINEPNRLLSIYNTAMRHNNVRDYPVILLGNVCGYSCPYVGQWDLEIPKPGNTMCFKNLIKFVNLQDGLYSKGDVGSVISELSSSYSNVVNNNTLEEIPIEIDNNAQLICDLTVGNRTVRYSSGNGKLYFTLIGESDNAFIAMDIYGNKPVSTEMLCRQIVYTIVKAMSMNIIRYDCPKTYGIVMELTKLYR